MSFAPRYRYINGKVRQLRPPGGMNADLPLDFVQELAELIKSEKKPLKDYVVGELEVALPPQQLTHADNDLQWTYGMTTFW